MQMSKPIRLTGTNRTEALRRNAMKTSRSSLILTLALLVGAPASSALAQTGNLGNPAALNEQAVQKGLRIAVAFVKTLPPKAERKTTQRKGKRK